MGHYAKWSQPVTQSHSVSHGSTGMSAWKSQTDTQQVEWRWSEAAGETRGVSHSQGRISVLQDENLQGVHNRCTAVRLGQSHKTRCLKVALIALLQVHAVQLDHRHTVLLQSEVRTCGCPSFLGMPGLMLSWVARPDRVHHLSFSTQYPEMPARGHTARSSPPGRFASLPRGAFIS